MLNTACCFTDHRPQKFDFGFNEKHEQCLWIKRELDNEIRNMVCNGIVTFYTGMAMGTDIWCAEIVQGLQKQMPERKIELIAVIPFIGQADRWSLDYRLRYYEILRNVDEKVEISDVYTKACMHERNRYMVEHSTHMIAVYNGSGGGTKRTLEYAEHRNVNIVIVDPGRIIS